MLFNSIMLTVPVVFLILSVVVAVKANQKGKSRKRTILMQLASFAAVFAICMVCPFVANAASDTATTTSATSAGLAYISAGISIGLSCIGGGIAVGNAAPAAIGATSEDPKAFGKAIIFVALGEGIALYGMLIAIMLISAAG